MTLPYFAALDTDGWTLANGEAIHEAHPETFWIPAKEARENLGAGDLAKLRFLIRVVDEEGTEEIEAERMWVEIIECVDTCYRGILSNQPASTDDFAMGSEVWFEPHHVIDILTGPTRQDPFDGG